MGSAYDYAYVRACSMHLVTEQIEGGVAHIHMDMRNRKPAEEKKEKKRRRKEEEEGEGKDSKPEAQKVGLSGVQGPRQSRAYAPQARNFTIRVRSCGRSTYGDPP